MLWKFGEGGEQPHLGQSGRASHVEALEGALGGFGGELIDFLNRGPATARGEHLSGPGGVLNNQVKVCSEQLRGMALEFSDRCEHHLSRRGAWSLGSAVCFSACPWLSGACTKWRCTLSRAFAKLPTDYSLH